MTCFQSTNMGQYFGITFHLRQTYYESRTNGQEQETIENTVPILQTTEMVQAGSVQFLRLT